MESCFIIVRLVHSELEGPWFKLRSTHGYATKLCG